MDRVTLAKDIITQSSYVIDNQDKIDDTIKHSINIERLVFIRELCNEWLKNNTQQPQVGIAMKTNVKNKNVVKLIPKKKEKIGNIYEANVEKEEPKQEEEVLIEETPQQVEITPPVVEKKKSIIETIKNLFKKGNKQ